MTDDLKAREAAALADFRDYIHANYDPGCVLSDPQWHAPKLFRAAVGSWLASMPVPETPNIGAIMMQLEDAVDACADQPLHMDRMTLTRTWRGILDATLPVADSARMDWLEAHGSPQVSAIEMDTGVYLDGPTIRAAIDAEMKT